MFVVSVDDHVAVIEFEFRVGAISDREMGSQVGGLRNKWNSPLRSLYQRPGGRAHFCLYLQMLRPLVSMIDR